MKYVIDEEELLEYFKEEMRPYPMKLIGVSDILQRFFKSKSPVEEIKIHGIQGNSGTGDGMLYVSKSDLMKNLVFDKIYVVVR